MKTAAAYIRVSTEEQAEYSPSSQLKLIRQYAQQNQMTLPEKYIFADEGISGKSTKARVQFNRMIAQAKLKPKPFEAILLWKFSRFARNRQDSVVYKAMLRKQLGIEVISVSENIGHDSTSILIEALIEAMDEYYSINLSQEVRRGMTEKVSRGEPVSVPAFGYCIKDGCYKVDETETKFVKLIFSEFLLGSSFQTIADILNNLGAKTHRGNPFEGRTIKYILSNPVYTGKIRWNPKGKTDRKFDCPELMIIEGAHEAIIDEKTWESVNKKLNERRIHHHEKSTGDYMLKGLIKCDSCGANLVKSSKLETLQCSSYAHGNCKISHSVSNKKLELAVISAAKILLNSRKISLKIEAEDSADILRINLAKSQLCKEERKLERIKDAFENGVYTLCEYKNSKHNIEEQIHHLKATQKALCKSLPPHRKTSIKPQTIESLLSDESISDSTKNHILRLFIERIIFDRLNNKLDIIFKI